MILGFNSPQNYLKCLNVTHKLKRKDFLIFLNKLFYCVFCQLCDINQLLNLSLPLPYPEKRDSNSFLFNYPFVKVGGVFKISVAIIIF